MPETPKAAFATLKTLLTTQHLAVVATLQDGHPYTSLVAFVASDDLRHVAFVTRRESSKFRNLTTCPEVSLLVDSRTRSAEDLTAGVAVTALGRAAEIVDKADSALFAAFLRTHPHLEAFARAPATALCGVEVQTYLLVTRFQDVVEMKIGDGAGSDFI